MTRRVGARSVALLAAASLLLVAAGCSDDESPPPAAAQGDEAPRARTERAPTERARPEPRLRRARCPESAPPGCRSASGRIVYVERVDPDGDGDAHFVLLSRESITGPGLTVVDVRRDLRPRPLPGVGDRISAAGPVYPGSYGQRQIEARELRVSR